MRRISVLWLAIALLFAATGTWSPVPGSAAVVVSGRNAALVRYIRLHGYLPLRGLDTLRRAKAHAAAVVAARRESLPLPVRAGAAPVIGPSWQGISDPTASPPDPNGAVGPNGYVEIINQKIAIYGRLGALIAQAGLEVLTNDSSGALSDPMVLWDPHTQRFYYNVWDVSDSTMDWGFSKSADPTAIPGSFCHYTASFGYSPSTDIPDYPKLGQTKNFLMIGVNHYPNFSTLHADRSDLLWITKPQGSGTIATCPSASKFSSGKFVDLRNQDGSQAWTPVPAIQTDPSQTGFVLASSDIECPDLCGSGMLLTVYGLRPSKADPSHPKLTRPHSIEVGSFESPPDAPQSGSAATLDTLDGRLDHAVSGVDPSLGKTTVWVAHTVLGGAGAAIRWYEILPTPIRSPTVADSGTVRDAALYVFNAGISNDRTCDGSTCAHGDAMVLGFTTSSASTLPAIRMVSKVGTSPQSAFVLVKLSTAPDGDFTCHPGPCRWGDYGGATPDPAAGTAGSTGRVWLSNQWTNGAAQTWNWQASP